MSDEPTLDDKQRLFVDAFCGAAGGCATKAARTAKYAHPAEAGYRLKRIPAVRAAIDAHLRESAATAGEVLAALTEIGLSREEKTSDRVAALALLGKFHSLFTDKVEHSGEIRFPDLAGKTDAELEAIAAGEE